MMYARFTTSTRLPVLLDCLRQGFDRLGLPDELLVDNMKQAVERNDVATGIVHWNRSFLAFVHHHDVHPLACPPYWPRVKGKVERGIGYVKGSFLEGRCLIDVIDLNRQLEVWLDTVANVRVHGTTKARPVDRFVTEQVVLRPLAAVPVYDVRPVEYRQVSVDSHLSYHGVLYSVHPDAAGRTVMVRPEGDWVGVLFSVYLGDTLVACHRREPKDHPRVTCPDHAAAICKLRRRPPDRAPRKQPRFEQIEVTVAPRGWRSGVAPAVQIRSLQTYDAMAAS